MRAVNGARKKSPNSLQRQRNGLLGLVHIAPQQLGFSEEERLAALARFGVSSSSALSIPELEKLVKYYQSLGFVKKPKKQGAKRWKFEQGNQVAALQQRARSEAEQIENGEKRLAGLVKSKCGVDDLRFCQDVGKLKRLLRILAMIRENEPGFEV